MNMQEAERIISSGALTEDDLTRLRDFLSPKPDRYGVTVTYQQMDDLAGWKVDSIGAVKYFDSPKAVEVVKSDDTLRLVVVGSALPCDGGWILSGDSDTVFVLMDDVNDNARTIKMKYIDGRRTLVEHALDLDEALSEGDVNHAITFAMSYAEGSLEMVQEAFNSSNMPTATNKLS